MLRYHPKVVNIEHHLQCARRGVVAHNNQRVPILRISYDITLPSIECCVTIHEMLNYHPHKVNIEGHLPQRVPMCRGGIDAQKNQIIEYQTS